MISFDVMFADVTVIRNGNSCTKMKSGDGHDLRTGTVESLTELPLMDSAFDGEGCAEVAPLSDMVLDPASASACIVAAYAFRDAWSALIRASAAVPRSLACACVGEFGRVPAADIVIPSLRCLASNASSRSWKGVSNAATSGLLS